MANSFEGGEVKKLADLIKGIRIAMLTTLEADGTLRSRPMATQDEEFDGFLWFFTRDDSPKVSEATPHRHVNVTYSDPHNNKYVSVSGSADLIRDKDKFKELWRPTYAAWFADGVDDPNIALLKVSVNKAEYWTASGGPFAGILIAAKTAVGSKEKSFGEHEKLELASV